MTLEEYQRALVTLSFAEAPALSEYGPLVLYRELVRSRLFAMAQNAYRRSWAALGEARANARFARFLAAHPPASPLIREVIAAFAAFALRDGLLFEGAPAFAPTLLRFEAAKWRVACAPDSAPSSALRELDFEGALALNPTLELVALEHAIDGHGEPSLAVDPQVLLVYRRPEEDEVHWYRAPWFLSDLLALAQESEGSLSELLPRVLSARGHVADEAFLHELAAALAVAVERRVLLGVRASAEGAQTDV